MYVDAIKQMCEYFRAQKIAVNKGTNSIGMPKIRSLPPAFMGRESYGVAYGGNKNYDPLRQMANVEAGSVNSKYMNKLQQNLKTGQRLDEKGIEKLFQNKNIYGSLRGAPQYMR